METKELLKKVRKIEIKSKGLTNHIFAGRYHSAFKGRGMAFNEVREYQYGDDIRNIDWNVTARYNHPYVKVFEEERELTVMLIVDVSGSSLFASRSQLRREIITEISAVIAYSAAQNNDKVGLILFSDKIEKYIPPKKGKQHVLLIIRELLNFKSESNGTDIGNALKYFFNVSKKRCITFLLSDFIDDKSYEKPFKIAAKKHDLISIHIYDELEKNFPEVGLVNLYDIEKNEELILDTTNKRLMNIYNNIFLRYQKKINDLSTKTGNPLISIRIGEDYIKPLILFFKQRISA